MFHLYNRVFSHRFNHLCNQLQHLAQYRVVNHHLVLLAHHLNLQCSQRLSHLGHLHVNHHLSPTVILRRLLLRSLAFSHQVSLLIPLLSLLCNRQISPPVVRLYNPQASPPTSQRHSHRINLLYSHRIVLLSSPAFNPARNQVCFLVVSRQPSRARNHL